MLKRKNDRQPPQRLEEERYPNDYWLDEEDGGEDISEPADSSKPVSGRLHSEPMVTGYEALERQRGVRRPNRKLTRREKKALKRAQKYEAKLHKEHEKADKKNAIRQGIIDSAGIYSQSLAGKTFLYVYGEEFFEVSFPIDHFLHLTGVETKLSAKDFYKNAKKAKLTSSQFYFDARHPYANARKKLPCLKRLPELTNDMVCILKEMQTVTIIYKLSVTNLEFTLGLTENTDVNGKKINDFFLPMSLRVEDTSVEKSNDGEIVDFIFSKDASVAKYDTLLVEDKNKMIPDNIKHLISEKLYSTEHD